MSDSEKAKYTPGPWAVGLDQSTQPKTNVYHRPPLGGGGFMKLAVCYESFGENSCNVPKEEALANAKLIAAAPDMAESLKAMVREFASDKLNHQQILARESGRAALAKAGVV